MCGIVGILGSGAVAGQLVDALKRLEYRGYDSAGVITVDEGVLTRRRAPGSPQVDRVRAVSRSLCSTLSRVT